MGVAALFSRRLIMVAAACAAALAGAAAFVATSAAARPAHTARARPCRTSQLVVWLDTTGNGVAGGTYYKLEFTNVGARSCTLAGYPGVSAIRLTGAQIGSAASRNPQHPARRITLASARRAGRGSTTGFALLRITDVGVYGRSQCRPMLAEGLRVYPPNQSVSKTVPFPFRACWRTKPHVLTVEAVQAGG